MVDTLAIGSGAINAYRQALSTTSNNIANVNTPGYSRRALSIGESFPVQEGIFQFWNRRPERGNYSCLRRVPGALITGCEK